MNQAEKIRSWKKFTGGSIKAIVQSIRMLILRFSIHLIRTILLKEGQINIIHYNQWP